MVLIAALAAHADEDEGDVYSLLARLGRKRAGPA